MKNFKFTALLIVFALLTGFAVNEQRKTNRYLKEITQNSHDPGEVKIDRDTSVELHFHSYSGDIQPVVIHQRDSVLIPQDVTIDTGAIVKGYFTQRIYQREFFDSFISGNICDTTYAGNLYPGKFIYSLNIPEKTIKITETRTVYQSPKIVAGLGLTLPVRGSSWGGGPYLAYLSKKRYQTALQIDLINGGGYLSYGYAILSHK